eukprot:TRINITY_DN572_c1_g1_i1.p1 TRINITY_DN572_c1_g1~~TRINITY_DN572_c1_g1_i1.p1  ORF type:complete len:337 (+),score=76.01 TRINITY_DN572_c1_g1_i1:44-1054(+)
MDAAVPPPDAGQRLVLRRKGLVMSATCYQPHGTGRAPVAVLLHGFPDTPATWRHLAPRLVQHGFVVLVPVMRGYEEGSASHEAMEPRKPYRASYTLDEMADDVVAWVEVVEGARQGMGGVGGVALIGHDWGSMVAGTVVLRQPERVAWLVQLAVPHLHHMHAAIARHPIQILYSYYILVFQLCWLGEYLLRATAFVEYLWRTWCPPSPAASVGDDARRAARHLAASPRVAAAALGYYRSLLNYASADARAVHRLWRTAPPIPRRVRCLAVNGLEDGCIHPAVFRYCTRSVRCYEGWGSPDVVHVEVPGAGHWAHLEKPGEVNGCIVTFLTEGRAAG